jgi:hypothetical protein
MDPVFGIMLEVVRIASFQPNALNAETRRIERERELGSTGAVGADESVFAAMRATSREPMRLPRWFRFRSRPADAFGQISAASQRQG